MQFNRGLVMHLLFRLTLQAEFIIPAGSIIDHQQSHSI